jgi:hypothetical protein
LDEQRGGRASGNKKHTRSGASRSRETGRSASCCHCEKRNPAAFANSDSHDRSQAQSVAHAQEFAEADCQTVSDTENYIDPETDAEEERRAKDNAETIKREG